MNRSKLYTGIKLKAAPASFVFNLPSNNGFTLIELLMSVTVIMIVMAVVGGSFRLGIKAVEKGEKAIDEQNRLIMAVNYIYDQLEAASLDEHSLFDGTADTLRFFSKQINPMEEEALQDIEYQVVDSQNDGEADFVISVKDVFPLSGIEQNENKSILLSGISGFEISYLKRSGQDDVWQNQWKDEPGLPKAVRIVFSCNHQPVRVLTRILRQNKRLKDA